MSKRGCKITVHHRKPKSLGGSNDRRNLSYLTETRHRAWTTLFGNATPEVIVQTINKELIDPDYELVLVKKGNGGDIPLSELEGNYYFDMHQRRKKE